MALCEGNSRKRDWITQQTDRKIYRKDCVKVRREFGENKKLNFIYILIKFSFTRGLLPEGLEDTRLLVFFLLVIHSHTVTYSLGRGRAHASARSSLSHSHAYNTNVPPIQQIERLNGGF